MTDETTVIQVPSETSMGSMFEALASGEKAPLTPTQIFLSRLDDGVLYRVTDPKFLEPASHDVRLGFSLDDNDYSRKLLRQAQQEIVSAFKNAQDWGKRIEAGENLPSREEGWEALKRIKDVTGKYAGILDFVVVNNMKLVHSQMEYLVIGQDQQLMAAIDQYKGSVEMHRRPDPLQERITNLLQRSDMQEVGQQRLTPQGSVSGELGEVTAGGFLQQNIDVLFGQEEGSALEVQRQMYENAYANIVGTINDPMIALQLDSTTRAEWKDILPRLEEKKNHRVSQLTDKHASLPPPEKKGAMLG